MILSVSRRTDIPAFYSDWFINKIKEGFVYVRNPINKNQVSKIPLSPDVVDCIVFWTKNPQPLLKRISELSKYNYYFQFTLTSYGQDFEPHVPNKNELVKSFTELSTVIGKERVIWRYDPIILTEKYTLEYHQKYFESIAEKLSSYTEKCVISFVDLYKKCERNFKGTFIKEMTDNEIFILSGNLKQIASKYNMIIETSAEDVELSSLGIGHNRCIDNVLIERIIKRKIKSSKDKNQREVCGCIESIDIGAYNTCKHGCLYCYANLNSNMVKDNSLMHSSTSPLLFGEIREKDKIIPI